MLFGQLSKFHQFNQSQRQNPNEKSIALSPRVGSVGRETGHCIVRGPCRIERRGVCWWVIYGLGGECAKQYRSHLAPERIKQNQYVLFNSIGVDFLCVCDQSSFAIQPPSILIIGCRHSILLVLFVGAASGGRFAPSSEAIQRRWCVPISVYIVRIDFSQTIPTHTETRTHIHPFPPATHYMVPLLFI